MSKTLSAQQQAWQALVAQPLTFVDVRYLRECWPLSTRDEQYATISKDARFETRRAALLSAHFGLSALAQLPPPATADIPVLLLSRESFGQMGRRCGAIWHAATLSREIRGEAVSQLRNLLGNEVFALALAHRAAGGAVDLLRQPADLVEAIDRDGDIFVTAWLNSQPAELRQWLRLRLPLPPAEPAQPSQSAPLASHLNGPLAATGLNIVRLAAATLTLREEEAA